MPVELARVDQGAAVALLSVLTRHPQDGLPWIMELIVHGKAQGRGIGKSLAALAEDRFRAMGAERARLCTFEQMSSSREFWSALGWRAIRHNTRNENGQSVMVMEKSLVLA
ncbi:GNAT family N-acetyltransferase [Streptomyces sp. NPDC018955]|uniref:GNAT family N-acetyltransferase n=1 Tax=Streptomyces sp. NPDC018955 TaxID=3365055 RepID=UPI0037B15874